MRVQGAWPLRTRERLDWKETQAQMFVVMFPWFGWVSLGPGSPWISPGLPGSPWVSLGPCSRAAGLSGMCSRTIWNSANIPCTLPAQITQTLSVPLDGRLWMQCQAFLFPLLKRSVAGLFLRCWFGFFKHSAPCLPIITSTAVTQNPFTAW